MENHPPGPHGHRGAPSPLYAQVPGGVWLHSQATAAQGIAHGVGQPPVGMAQHGQWGQPEPPKKARQFEKMPLIKKKVGFLHLLPHLVMAPICFGSVAYVWSFVDRLAYWYVPYVVTGFFAASAALLLLYNMTRIKGSAWFVYAALSLLLANGLGFHFGNTNYQLVSDYVTFKGMSTYVNVNPSEDNGEGFADAGSVYFKEGSRVDVARAMAFKNTALFCVAPIATEQLDDEGQPVEASENDVLGASGTVDWWAVGQDCCNPSGEGFHCGEAGVSRSGLRELSLEDRQFYEFAVHQWTAKYKLPARHPLFFHWVTDPLGKVNSKMLFAQLAYHSACTYAAIATVVALACARITIDGFGL